MNTRTTRRACASLVAFAALAAGATACDSSGSGSGKASQSSGAKQPEAVSTAALKALREAVSKTEKAHSVKVDGQTTIGTTVAISQQGALEWSGGGTTGQLAMTQDGATGEQLKKLGSSGTSQTRYLANAMYVKMAGSFIKAMGGKHWLKYDYDAYAKLGGASTAFVSDQLQNSNPAQSVQMIIASGDVKKAGSQTVRGVRATHYSGTVDVAALAAKSDNGLSAKELKALKKQLEAAGIKTEQIDLWVNGDNLLVKKTEQGSTANGTMRSTTYYSGYGTKVSVTAPPAADTLDFTKLLAAQSAAPSA
jgi:hypothetical protein